MITQQLTRVVTQKGIDVIIEPEVLKSALSIIDIYTKLSNINNYGDLIDSLDRLFSKKMIIATNTGSQRDFWNNIVFARLRRKL